MARLLINTLLLFLVTSLFASSSRYELSVLFEKDRSELTSQAIEQLDAYLATLPLSGDQQFMVDGHTDSDGSRAYNEVLSKARALAVQEYLLEKGIATDLIMLEHYGERSPLAPNHDAESMALNRRVTVTYVHHALESVEDMNEALMDRKMQRFIIDPNVDEEIRGACGTLIRFTAGTLIDRYGRLVKDPVEIQLTEALDLQSMVANDLSTRSGDKLLETGGMLKLEAFSDKGEALSLRAGGSVEIAVPTDMPLEEMELFLSDDGSDWNVTGQELVVTTMELVMRRGPVFDPPLRPSTRLPFDMPRYKEDQIGKPNRPTVPERPRQPVAPREESYRIHAPWWKFWAKKQLSDMSSRRYEQAVARYEQKMEKFEEKLAYYNSQMASHDERMERYTERMEAWNIQKKEEYDNWCQTVKLEAFREYAQRTEANAVNADSLLSAWRAEYEQSWETWQTVHRSYLDSMATAMDQNNNASVADLNTYLFNTNRFGWINCDRFINARPDQMHEIIVKNKSTMEGQVMLVFQDINSVLTMYPNEQGEYTSGRIPRGQKATLFAYTVIDGRAHLCVQPVTGSIIPESLASGINPKSWFDLRKGLQTGQWLHGLES